jgi:hypothetical protein
MADQKSSQNAKQELEELLLNISEEEHKALSDLIDVIPVKSKAFDKLVKGLSAKTRTTYEAHIKQLTKLNALIELNNGKDVQSKKTENEEVQQHEQKIELTKELTKEITFSDVAEILETSIKHDYTAKVITFAGMLLAQTNDDQFNVAYQAASSMGKSYIALETAAYFPTKEIEEVAFASPTSFYHDNAIWDEVRKILIRDIEHKILIFIDMPHWQLLARLRPILSHDKKELLYKITDKTQKYGLKTKNVVVRGFASVFFATTSFDSDEQEQTRMFILSPLASQEKLKETIELATLKKSNVEEYRKKVLQNPQRIWLCNRIKAIRQTCVRDIIIPKNGLDVYNKFMQLHGYLLPRHQRDIVRIIALIKAHALLNCFNREKIQNGHADSAIIATEQDINAGFELYSKIESSNMLGISPYAYEIFTNVIQPNLNEEVGLSIKKIRQEYFAVYHKVLDSNTEKSLLMQYESAGLIERMPDPEDKRRMLVYPTVHINIFQANKENTKNSIGDAQKSTQADSNTKYIDIDGGVKQQSLLEQYPREVQPD